MLHLFVAVVWMRMLDVLLMLESVVPTLREMLELLVLVGLQLYLIVEVVEGESSLEKPFWYVL